MHNVQNEFVVDKGGEKTIIFPIAQHEKLMEDVHDLAVVAERRKEKPISYKEMKRRLKKHGLLL